MNSIAIDPNRIRDRAYARWQERGCPEGSADQDWLEAEEALACEVQAPSAARVPPAAGAGAPNRVAVSKEPSKSAQPPRPTLKRPSNARSARLLNEVAPKGPPLTRAQRAIAAAAAAYAKRSAVGSG